MLRRMCRTLLPWSLVLAACSSATSVSSEAACAQPKTRVSVARATPGQVLGIFAADMWDGCNDQGTNLTLPPLTNQPVTMTREGKAVEVGRVSADPDNGVAQAKVTIPATATPGKIELTIGIAQPAEVDVVSRSRG